MSQAKKLKHQNSWNPTRRCSSLTNNLLGIPPLLGIWRCAELGAYTILVGLIEHPNAQATNLPARWDEVCLSDGGVDSGKMLPIFNSSMGGILTNPTPWDFEASNLGGRKRVGVLDGSLLIFWNSSSSSFRDDLFKKSYDTMIDYDSWDLQIFTILIHGL